MVVCDSEDSLPYSVRAEQWAGCIFVMECPRHVLQKYDLAFGLSYPLQPVAGHTPLIRKLPYPWQATTATHIHPSTSKD